MRLEAPDQGTCGPVHGKLEKNYYSKQRLIIR